VELAEPRRNIRLTLLGVFILGILGKIAMGAGDLDFLRKLVVQLVLEEGDFVLELLFDFLGQIDHWALGASERALPGRLAGTCLATGGV